MTNRKVHITQFTEAEFLQLLRDIYESNGEDAIVNANTELYRRIIEVPDALQLIFWPKVHNGEPENVLNDIRAWYAAHNKPFLGKG